jgi:riboflavin synthase
VKELKQAGHVHRFVLGGHIVQGHVDGTGTITEMKPEGDSLWITVKVDSKLLKYIVTKGTNTFALISKRITFACQKPLGVV